MINYRLYSWKGLSMSVYEALTLAISFAMLVIAILKFNQKK